MHNSNQINQIYLIYFSELKEEYSEPSGSSSSTNVPQLLQAIYGYRQNVFNNPIQQQQQTHQRHRKFYKMNLKFFSC